MKESNIAAVKESPERSCLTHTKSCSGQKHRIEEIRGGDGVLEAKPAGFTERKLELRNGSCKANSRVSV